MECGSPGFPKNGDTVVDRTTYNSVVTYSCDEGYILIGDKNRTCHGNGTWSGVLPECERKFKTLSSISIVVATYCVFLFSNIL